MSLLAKRGVSVCRGTAAVRRLEAEAEMSQAIALAERAYAAQQAARANVEAERDRCARIAEQFPDNLMARHIAQAIRRGGMTPKVYTSEVKG